MEPHLVELVRTRDEDLVPPALELLGEGEQPRVDGRQAGRRRHRPRRLRHLLHQPIFQGPCDALFRSRICTKGPTSQATRQQVCSDSYGSLCYSDVPGSTC